MMRLLIKQRVFSWTDTYDVYDEDENIKYFVKSELFSFGHKIHVYDTYENEVGMIREKLISFLPVFEMEIGGKILGKIEKKFSLFKPRYEVECNGWSIEGDLMEWNYDVYDGDRVVVQITKEWLSWGDTYVLDISDPEDELLGLLLVIAIDAANCDRNG